MECYFPYRSGTAPQRKGHLSRDLKEPALRRSGGERGGQVPVHRLGKKAGAKGASAMRWEMKAEATCRGLVLAKVRSLAFIRNSVGEARGFKVGFRLVSEITVAAERRMAEDKSDSRVECQGPPCSLVCTRAGPERRASGGSRPRTPRVTGVPRSNEDFCRDSR